jgi:ubiquinone/menaquinone biosynthesis C-methylase UbiE
MIRISALVPVWNEERRLAASLEILLHHFSDQEKDGSEIVICADGCTDGTLNVAKEYAEKFPQIKIADWPERLGKGGGILNGLRFAGGDITVITDVDLSAPMEQLPKLVSQVASGKADLIIGSRNLAQSIITEKPPIHRKVLGKGFNLLFRLLFAEDFHDTQCGLKVVRTRVLRDLAEDLTVEGYAFDIDLIVKALRKGYKVVEVPVVWGYHKGSKVGALHQMFKMAHDLILVWLENKKREPRQRTSERMKRAFYDNVAGDTYHKATRSLFLPRSAWHRGKNILIAQFVGKHKKVLDVGCGSGAIVERLLPECDICGIDIGKGFVRFCQDRYGRSGKFSIVRSDARQIPFHSESFDYVICSEVLEHVRDRMAVLNEFFRSLRPGGRLILTTPKMSVRWCLLEAVWTRIRRKMIEIEHRPLTEGRLRYLVSLAGFRILTCRKILLGFLVLCVVEKPRTCACLAPCGSIHSADLVRDSN